MAYNLFKMTNGGSYSHLIISTVLTGKLNLHTFCYISKQYLSVYVNKYYRKCNLDNLFKYVKD